MPWLHIHSPFWFSWLEKIVFQLTEFLDQGGSLTPSYQFFCYHYSWIHLMLMGGSHKKADFTFSSDEDTSHSLLGSPSRSLQHWNMWRWKSAAVKPTCLTWICEQPSVWDVILYWMHGYPDDLEGCPNDTNCHFKVPTETQIYKIWPPKTILFRRFFLMAWWSLKGW